MIECVDDLVGKCVVGEFVDCVDIIGVVGWVVVECVECCVDMSGFYCC